MVLNSPYLENKHGDAPFFYFWLAKVFFTSLRGKLQNVHGNSLGSNNLVNGKEELKTSKHNRIRRS